MRRRYDSEKYTDYLKSQWWWDLKYKLITCNDQAKCFICHRKDTLLVHHVNYKALHEEKLNKDVYILCIDCHTATHFWFFKLIKVPLTTNALLFSMRLRRTLNCLNNGELGLFLIWFLVTFTIGGFYFSAFFLWKAIKISLKITQMVIDTLLKLSLRLI